MLRTARLALLSFAVVTLVACAGGGLKINYTVLPAPGEIGATPSVRVVHSGGSRHFGDADALVVPMFRQVMASKGYPDGGAQATLELVYEVRKEHLSGMELTPIITPSGAMYQKQEFVDMTKGAVAVLVVDVATGKTIYTASTSGEIKQKLSNEKILALVNALMKQFPAVAQKK